VAEFLTHWITHGFLDFILQNLVLRIDGIARWIGSPQTIGMFTARHFSWHLIETMRFDQMPWIV
jgi:hypothetical protein